MNSSADVPLFDMPVPCSVADCSRPVPRMRKRAGLCEAHFKRWWRYGDPLAGGPARPWVRAGRPVRDFPDGTRICNNCEERLPVDSFHKDARGTGGRRSQCARCELEKAKEWHEQNREVISARMKAYRVANLEAIRERDARRYERDRAKRIALATQQSHKRKLRILGGEYDPTVTRANLRKQYGDACFYCEQVMDFRRYTHTTRPQNLATIEHVWPVSKGGGHTWENVVLACLSCNITKNARTGDDWLAGGSNDCEAA